MATGIVKFFNEAKGYGFIKPDDGGKDVFVHISDLRASGVGGLDDRDPVVFDLAESRDGRPKAVKLSVQLVE